MSRRPRSLPGWVLIVAFVGVPLLEIFVLIQVGQVIGAWWTIVLLIADSIFGGWLVKREGRRAWRALTDALNHGRMPARELADGGLILVGGTLMLTPGFVTDLVGMLLILPFTRPIARGALTRYLAARIVTPPFSGPSSAPFSGPNSGTGPDRGGRVVPGEVVD
ncbi:MAG: FxsA family protein [Nocardioides sp.]